ncbi:MAG: glycosyltransferase family 2 protein [Patescibacteria group bacterium]
MEIESGDNPYYLKLGRATDLEDKKERRIYRLFEILPGFLSWITLILVVFLSWITPVFIAFFIITFDVYWLLKTIFLSLHLRVGFSETRKNMKTDWMERLKLEKEGWEDFYHLLILPVYNEGMDIVEPTMQSILNSNYPKDKMIVVFATEERVGENAEKLALDVKEKFGDKFFRFLITKHPKDIVGEMAGKGSNIAWAGKSVKEKIIDKEKIQYDKIIVSALDIDTVMWKDYFSRLMYVYLSRKNPSRASYQPIPFYINNIWQAPAIARVISFSATFWHTLQQERPERMTTFSSHSMSFQALVDVDFWQVNMVSEDSRIFWQCFLRYDGDYSVVPLYYPVSMDANVAPKFWQTMVNQYKQQRRWGYGAENVPYFLFGFWKNKKISFNKKWHYTWTIMEGFHSWATNALIIFLLGWLPLYLGGEAFNKLVLAYNLPEITKSIMMIAMLGIVTSVILTMMILPPKPPEYGKFKYLIMIIQWPLLFVTIVVFGSFPGLEAQTRLMLGKYMGFWVTPKGR